MWGKGGGGEPERGGGGAGRGGEAGRSGGPSDDLWGRAFGSTEQSGEALGHGSEGALGPESGEVPGPGEEEHPACDQDKEHVGSLDPRGLVPANPKETDQDR